MSQKLRNSDSFSRLAEIAGFAPESLVDYLMWCIQENLICDMRRHAEDISKFRKIPDGMNQFKKLVESKTGIVWDIDNIRVYYENVLRDQDTHYLQKIDYEELLRLIINAEKKCVKCGATPPSVKLHIDHILPASRGGSSKFENLQFLCQHCNLKKSNKKEAGDLWIKLESLR
jgi:hypothetical protein